MDVSKLTEFRTVLVVFEDRSDGGVRVYSDDVPGFFLSHPNRDAALADVAPALETIIGAIVGGAVKVELGQRQRSLPASENWRLAKEYEARAA